MHSPLDHHTQYILKYGYTRWVLRECVRANPLYVISAAVLAYGVATLESEIDPRVDQGEMKVLVLALLHAYELSVLFVATIVLKLRKPEPGTESTGGRDLHGLMLVMLLFLSGSFLAQDEIIATFPDYGVTLVVGSLVLAAIKLNWYSRLPGVALPWKFQAAMLALLAGHSCAPLWGGLKFSASGTGLALNERQGLAWFFGWLTITPMFLLIWRVERAAAADRALEESKAAEKVQAPAEEIEVAESASEIDAPRKTKAIPIAGPSGPDFLVTRFFGHVALFLTAILGGIHLYASDWVFERPSKLSLAFPAAMLLLAAWLAFGWYYRKHLSFFGKLSLSVPALGMNLLWYKHPEVWDMPAAFNLSTFVHPIVQAGLAVLVFYTGLAWASGRKSFLLGLLSLFCAPLVWVLVQLKNSLPHFKAWLCIGFGFIALFAGMWMSLIRQRLLRYFEAR